MISELKVIQIGNNHLVIQGDKILKSFSEINDNRAVENAYNFADEYKKRQRRVMLKKTANV